MKNDLKEFFLLTFPFWALLADPGIGNIIWVLCT